VIPYVKDLKNIVEMDAIRAAGLKLGVDPLGGAAELYWEPIISVYGLDITVVNPTIDPTFSFISVDHDGHGLVRVCRVGSAPTRRNAFCLVS
jgi:phosphoglucomutase